MIYKFEVILSYLQEPFDKLKTCDLQVHDRFVCASLLNMKLYNPTFHTSSIALKNVHIYES